MKIRPKKSLGQNFLSDKNVIKSIVKIGNIKNNNTILEIGPGTGNLTEFILKKKPKNFFVIEKDYNLVKFLYEKFDNKINIINKDVLNFELNAISKEKIIVYGNLPYNISTEILTKWITDKKKFESCKKLILMFQKEVADRIIAKTNSKNYGRLSIISNWRMDVKKEFDINPNCFFPKPKVDSTLLSFEPKKKYFNLKNPNNLEKITKVFFNQRRKMIKNPLKQIFKNPYIIVQKLKLDTNLIFAVLITGILLPVFMVFVGYSSNYIQTLIFYILCTLIGSSNHIFVKSIIHYRAPANYRGKILSLMEVTGSSITTSSLFVGPLVGWIGIPKSFVTLCLLAFILITVGFFFYYKFSNDELEKNFKL